MLQHERIATIKKLIEEDGKVLINDLAVRFDVSKVTVRKDLDEMSANGLIQRFYGGAVSITEMTEMSQPQTSPERLWEKHPQYPIRKQIAAAAATRVCDGDTIFLGSGMTCTLLAEELANKKGLTVITNNISALPKLLEMNANIVIIGGEIISVDNTTYFSWTESSLQYMKNLFVTKAFTSCTGVDLQAGLTVSTVVSTYVYKCIPDIKREWCLLVDKEKFNKIGPYVLNAIEAVDCVISDGCPKEYTQRFAQSGIESIVV